MGAAVPAAVTFGELADLIRTELSAGYDRTEKQEGRRRLLAVVEQLAGTSSRDNDPRLLAGRTWRIAQVHVGGLGGIATLDPTPLMLSPVCGVTVVRGPNGHGKTSLARSIDCGLRGRPDVSNEASGALWAADLLAEGTDAATVELLLVSGPDRLTIRAAFPRSDPSSVTATLADSSGTRPVVIDDAWRRALLASRACYSYGALETRLTEHKALQAYLEELLVLGPVWEQVRDEVTARAERATRARKTVDTARRAAVQGEQALAERFAADDRAPEDPAPVVWPKSRDAVHADTWLQDTGLATAQPPRPVRVDATHETRIAELHAELLRADLALAAAELALDTPGMAAALEHIDRLAALQDLDDRVCPLCGSETDWRTQAREVVSGMQARRIAADAVRAAVAATARWVEATLTPLLAAGVTGGPDIQVAAFRETWVDGYHARSSAHEQARSLLDALTSDRYREWLRRLRSASDATAEWRAELSTLAHRFAAELREHGGFAAQAGAWQKATETLDELQLGFRQQRQDAVTSEMHTALRRMLPDADIELTGIQHTGGIRQQRGVQVGLAIGGREARLGMLSSGQRNALLLTPLTILDESGSFGFLVVDDPVHALDDMRVDLLAAELARLGQQRQVLVLTHDPRLEEHLRSRVHDLTVVELHRDPRRRSVSWTPHSTPWQALLDDARGICLDAAADGWGYGEPLDSVVAGLCRAAVDGALRQAVITRATSRADDVGAALATLGEARETRKRINHVVRLAGGAGRLPHLEHGRDRHLVFWNRGAHGQLPAGVDLQATITAAANACTELTAFDWSVA